MKILVLCAALLLPCLAANPDVEKEKTLGNPAAPLMLEVYGDYMCPACNDYPLFRSYLDGLLKK